MSTFKLIKNLRLNKIFQSIDIKLYEGLDDQLELVEIDRGEDLFKAGDAGTAIFVLIKGKLNVRLKDAQGKEFLIGEESEPGTCIGEMALITGQNRAVTIQALSDSKLVRLSKAGFDKLTERSHQVLIEITKTMSPRWQRIQLSLVLRELLGEIEADTLLELQSRLVWQQLSHGEVLFHQDDPGDAAYIIVNGRLHISVRLSDGSDRSVDESGPGDIVGEFALLTNDVRSATVKAIRETNLVKLTPQVFTDLIERFPQAMIRISRIIIERHKQSLRFAPPRHLGSINFALIPAGPDVKLGKIAKSLIESSPALNPVLHLNSEIVDQNFGKQGISQTKLDDPTNPVLSNWLSGQEGHYKYILYQADLTWTTWTRRSIRQADRILIIADASGDPKLGPVEEKMRSLEVQTPVDLVLVHQSNVTRPSGTKKWLDQRDIKDHYHLSVNDKTHYQRLVRSLVGESIMLVLSGGGARGFAHLGVMRALEELGIPIDRIGGTSMGALLGAGYAMGRDYFNMLELAASIANPTKLFDYTLPYTSLMTTQKITDRTKEVFSDLYIEDLWRPFFCVSSNLTQGHPVIHQAGLLWKSVRASIAIPGIFAPILQGSDVLVDGGAMNNFPLDIMRDRSLRGIMIGVNVSPPKEIIQDYQFGPSISGWQVMWSHLNPLVKSINVPTLAGNLLRSMEINSVYKVKTTETLADVLIQPDIKDFGILDFASFEPIIEIGYQASIEQLKRIQSIEEGRYIVV